MEVGSTGAEHSDLGVSWPGTLPVLADPSCLRNFAPSRLAGRDWGSRGWAPCLRPPLLAPFEFWLLHLLLIYFNICNRVKERERDIASICSFTSQVVAKASAGQGGNQEFSFNYWVAGGTQGT